MAAIACMLSEYTDLQLKPERCQACTGVQCELEKKETTQTYLKVNKATTHGNKASVLPSLSLVSFLADAQMARQNAILFTKSARL